MSSAVFRKVALERLSSPEQLDRLVPVTTPRSWIALTTLLVMLAAFVAWSLFGHLATNVRASGILITRGGVVADALTPAGGTLRELRVKLGDKVIAGEVIGELTQTETQQRYASALDSQNEEIKQYKALERQLQAEDDINRANNDRRRQRLREMIGLGREKVETARRRVEDHRRLLEERVVTRVTLERSQQEFNQAQSELTSSLNALDDLDARDIERLNRTRERLETAQGDINAAARRVREVLISLETTSRVLAPQAGIVTEIKAVAGSIVSTGQAIVSIEGGGQGLEVVAYLPPDQGKRIKSGMTVNVSPVTFAKEEYGTLLGEVRSVSDFPMTTDGMLAVLQNRDLVQRFTHQGPPYAARIELRPAQGTASGYLWTSPKANDLDVTSGTLVSLDIETERKAPIRLAIPLLREATGL